MNKSSGMVLGLTLVLVGVLLLLDNMYLLDFTELFHTYWPVVFIIWGISKLMRRSPSPSIQSPSLEKVDGATSAVYPNSEASYLASSTAFGDYRSAIQSRSFTGGVVSATFGNIDLDLLNAELAEGDHSLKLDGVFGNTILHLPKDMAFVVFANTTFGNIRVNERQSDGISSSLDYASPDFDTAKCRLRISASRVFGNVRVYC